MSDQYISKYSNGKSVSAAQYITEIICEKRAKTLKVDLHYRFWTNKEWESYYRNQIASANKLLKTYNCKAIIRALNNPQSSKIYSLRAPHLIPIIEHETQQLNKLNTDLTQTYDRTTKEKFLTNKTTNNIFSKLKELE